MAVIQQRIEAVFHPFQSRSGRAAFSYTGMLQHRCNTSPEFFSGIVSGMKKDVSPVFHVHHLKVFPEPWAVAPPEPVSSFRNTRDPRLIVLPRKFNRFAELGSFKEKDSVDARGVVGSDQQDFHGYGVPETFTICSALWAPFFIS